MRAIKIDPETRTIEEIDIKGDLDSMTAVLNDGPCRVRLSRDDSLWLGDNGLLSPGNAIFLWRGYYNPLAGVGLIIGLDEMGENVAANSELEWVKSKVEWTDLESTGQLTPPRDYIDDLGRAVHTIGEGILRERVKE